MQCSKQSVVVLDPVKGRVREDHVDRLRDCELDEVLAEDRRAIPERLLRVLGHRWRDVDPVYATVRHPIGEERGHAARATTRVEHDLIPAQRQPLELLARPRELNVRDAVVGRRVPVA